MIPVLADLLPNVNELFECKGFFGAARVVRVQQDGRRWRSSRPSSASGCSTSAARKKAIVPGGLQNVAEIGLRDRRAADRGRGDGRRTARSGRPFLATLFFWIFFINIWSVVPFI